MSPRKTLFLIFLPFVLLGLLVAPLYIANFIASQQFVSALIQRHNLLGRPFSVSDVTDFAWDRMCVLNTDRDDSLTPWPTPLYRFVQQNELQYGTWSQNFVAHIPKYPNAFDYDVAVLFLKGDQIVQLFKYTPRAMKVSDRFYVFDDVMGFGACSKDNAVEVSATEHHTAVNLGRPSDIVLKFY